MNYVILVLAALVTLYTAKSCTDKNRQIRKLTREVETLKEERPEIWIDSCKSSVYRSCFYADCAVTAIEVMQEKICREAPEDL
jgi:hypothetical protein